MRSDTLLFFHVLAALALVGGALAAALAGLAARRAEHLRPLVWQTALFVVLPAAIVTVALGEALQAKEDIDAAWLDASYGLAYLGLVGGAAALGVLGRLATRRPRLGTAVSALGLLVTAVALAVTFLMAGKPS